MNILNSPRVDAKKHIGFLDQVRGIAVLSVLLLHCFGQAFGRSNLAWSGWTEVWKGWHVDFGGASKFFLFTFPLSYGWAGVAIFFVVSGFCIHLNFRQNPDWQAFFLRRFFRIYPPYFFALVLFALFIPWTDVGYTFKHKLFQMGSHLVLLNNFHSQTIGSINPVFWSIAVEVQLYLMYPLLVFGVSRWGWHRCLTWLAVLEFGIRGLVRLLPNITGIDTGIWWQGLPVTYSWLVGFPLMYWFSWAIGAAIADAYVTGGPLPFARSSFFAWGAIAVGSYLIKDLCCFTFAFFAILSAVGIAKLLQKNYFLRLPGILSKPLRQVGLISYSLYLLHWPFLSRAPQLAEKMHWPGTPPAVFAAALILLIPIFALAAGWYWIFELPSIAIGKRLIRRLKPTNEKSVPTAQRAATNA